MLRLIIKSIDPIILVVTAVFDGKKYDMPRTTSW